MAKTYLVPVQMSGNQTLGFRMENLATAPGSPYGSGHGIYNTTLGAPQFYDGAVWRNPFARGDHTGTQIAATISNLAATVQGYSLSLFGAPTGNLGFGGFKAVNLGTPTTAGDGATYDWTLSRPLNAFAVPTAAVPFGNQKITGLGTATVPGDAADFSFVRNTRLDQFATPTAAVPFGNQKITNLAQPTVAGDAAEYSWVIANIQSSAAGIASKPPVTVAATGNVVIASNGLAAVNGYTPLDGDRVLLPAQTTATENGVYNAHAGAWTRTTIEGAAPGEIEAGAMWLSTAGNSAGSQYRVSNAPGAITIGSTPINIVLFGAGQSYSNGNGLTLTAGVFAVLAASGGGLLVAAAGVSVDFTIVSRHAGATLGDGTSTSFTVTHNLGTQDILVAVRLISSQAVVEVDWAATSNTTATITFASAPAANAYRAVVMG